MLNQSLRRLLVLTGTNQPSILLWIVSALFAVSCGAMILLLGFFFCILSQYYLPTNEASGVTLGKYIRIPTEWIAANTDSVRLVFVLLGGLLLSVTSITMSFYLTSRISTSLATRNLATQLESIYQQLLNLIRRRSPTLLQPYLLSLVVEDAPNVREASSQWYRIATRHICMFTIHILIAVLIEPSLTLLSILLALLLQQFYATFDRRRRRMRPVVYERRQIAMAKFAEWLGNGPLISTVSREQFGKGSLMNQINSLRNFDLELDRFTGWKSTVMLGLVGLAFVCVLFASAVQMLRSAGTLNPVAILTLYAAIVVAVYSLYRVVGLQNVMQQANPSIDRLIAFLSQEAPEVQLDPNVSVPDRVRSIQLQKVTLRNHTDEVVVDSITANFHAGEITAIVSDSESAQYALADLLLGFGYPSQGDCLVEGVPLSRLGVDRLGDMACWVSSVGPLLAGMVEDNLRTVKNSQSMSADLNQILRQSHCINAIEALPDGLATLISPNDDRLKDDFPFRLGIARALTLNKPIVVLQEPHIPRGLNIEAETREVMEELANRGMVVILLPARPKSLWSAHQVIFIQGGKLIAVGKHATLLEQNDAYRHWNYMKFSPHIRS